MTRNDSDSQNDGHNDKNDSIVSNDWSEVSKRDEGSSDVIAFALPPPLPEDETAPSSSDRKTGETNTLPAENAWAVDSQPRPHQISIDHRLRDSIHAEEQRITLPRPIGESKVAVPRRDVVPLRKDSLFDLRRLSIPAQKIVIVIPPGLVKLLRRRTLAIGLTLVLVAFGAGIWVSQTEPEGVDAIVTPQVDMAPAPDPVTEQYDNARLQFSQIIAQISGDKPTETPDPNGAQSIDSLAAWLLEHRDSALANALSTKYGEDAAFIEYGSRLSYEQIWQLGNRVLELGGTLLDILDDEFAATPPPGFDEYMTHQRMWLTEWRLSERGLYCQVRGRYWSQVKTGNPPISKEFRGGIQAIRKERRHHLKVHNRANTPLYRYCR